MEAFYARHGWRVRLYPSCRARHATLDYLAGSDEQRLADLHAAMADDERAATTWKLPALGAAVHALMQTLP